MSRESDRPTWSRAHPWFAVGRPSVPAPTFRRSWARSRVRGAVPTPRGHPRVRDWSLADRLSQNFDVSVDLFFRAPFGHGHEQHVVELALDRRVAPGRQRGDRHPAEYAIVGHREKDVGRVATQVERELTEERLRGDGHHAVDLDEFVEEVVRALCA